MLERKLAVGETLTLEKYNDKLEAWLKITSTGITWADNKSAILQSATDITEQKNQEMRVAEMAYEDALTGIANRRAMERYLEKKFVEFQETNNPICVVMVDIDNFKHINDTYGHDAGDAILKSTAAILKNSVRAHDKVCRWGGEEFVICFSHVDLPMAVQVSDRLRKKIAENKVALGDKELWITVSMGIAKFKAGDNHYSNALHNADKSMYHAKSHGKNQVTCIDFDAKDL